MATNTRRLGAAAVGGGSSVGDLVRGVIGGGGQPLDSGTRDYFGRHFGRDFSAVRLHTDAAASRAADALDARAFTVGNHVVFRSPFFSPTTPRARRLLAHELAHVVQQSGAPLRLGGLTSGRMGDAFEREADAAARRVLRGARVDVRPSPYAVPSLQKEDLKISDFDPNDIDPKLALADPDYVDNGLLDGKLRGNGSVFNPVFVGFTLFYKDGSVLDIPAAANSAFPAFAAPTAPVMTIFRRHLPSGKIFPITLLQSDFFAASGKTTKDVENNALAAHAQYLLYKTLCPAIDVLFTYALAGVAFAYSGLIAQIWNLGMGIRGAIQIFTVTGAMRAMAAGRAAYGVGGAAAGQTTTQALAAIVRNVLKTGTLSATEAAEISTVETRLTAITQRAIANVNAGTATGPWAQRLVGMATTDPMYKLTLGNAIHEEAFDLARQEIRAGTLPAGLQSNVGRAIPSAGLPNSYGRLRPDFRLPIGNGNEAVFDITTAGQAGHAQPYTTNSWVKYVVELLY